MKKIGIKEVFPFLALTCIAIASLFFPTAEAFADTSKYVTGDMAWVIVATALVFLMTPGLAFFYGGMVNRKNVLSTMIKSFVATGIVTILWLAVGYGMSFGTSLNELSEIQCHICFIQMLYQVHHGLVVQQFP